MAKQFSDSEMEVLREEKPAGQAACPICGSKNRLLKFLEVEDLEYQTYKAVNFLDCPDCGLLQQEPLPARHDLAAFYPQEYRNYMKVQPSIFSVLKDLQALGFAARIGKHIGDPAFKKILDIGFGNGQLLCALHRRGARKLYGSDFSKHEFANLEEIGVRLAFGDIECEFPFDEKFDCIIMNNVIEHFLDPIAVLHSCKQHLNAGGKLILVTPNAKAWELGLFGKYWAGFHAPRHTFLFSKANLHLLADKLGFSHVETENFNDPGQWAISIQNQCQSAAATRLNLRNGLAPYTVALSILLQPLVLFQNLFACGTSIFCTLENQV